MIIFVGLTDCCFDWLILIIRIWRRSMRRCFCWGKFLTFCVSLYIFLIRSVVLGSSEPVLSFRGTRTESPDRCESRFFWTTIENTAKGNRDNRTDEDLRRQAHRKEPVNLKVPIKPRTKPLRRSSANRTRTELRCIICDTKSNVSNVELVPE